jgi:outer membrane protein TolC
MKKGDRELNQSRAELINNLKETRAEAERLLRLHEAERQRALEDYIRRRDSYYQGLVARNEVLQAEQTLLEAMARVDNDKRWIAEADLALMEYVKGNSK